MVVISCIANVCTALQMALFQDSAECVSELLRHGADPLAADGDARAAAHRAAAAAPAALHALLRAAARRAREILKQHADLWRPHFERKTDKELADHLLYKMCVMCDDQGYTPLMLASKEGKSENVKLLIEAAPSTINMRMPNCGNTALYLAVTAACLDCYNRGNKTEVSPNFYATIDALVEGGADPTIDNDSGSNVNLMLTEFSIGKLSMLIANKLTSSKFFDGNEAKDFNSYMLVKDSEGKVNLQELKSAKPAPPEPKEKVTAHIVTLDANNEPRPLVETARRGTKEQTDTALDKPKKKIKKQKPVILQNIPVVTQLVSLAQPRNRPLILKKFNGPKDAAETRKVVTLAQNFIPGQAPVPMKFVKILPKADVQPPPAPLAATPPTPPGVTKRAKSELNRSSKKIKL